MDLFRTVKAGQQYGPLPAEFTYDLRLGYTALVGPNNAGKSSLLQLIFRDLSYEGDITPKRLALILPDREYVQPTTETGGRTLEAWNIGLRNEIQGVPLTYGAAAIGPMRSEQTRVLMHGDLVEQFSAMNEAPRPNGPRNVSAARWPAGRVPRHRRRRTRLRSPRRSPNPCCSDESRCASRPDR